MASFSAVFNTLIWLGALQGFILATLLWFLKQNRRSSRLLAALIFLMALACLHISLFKTGLLNYNGIVATLSVLIPLLIVMPIGPLIWLYVLTWQGKPTPQGLERRFHFLPVLIDLVPSLTVILFFGGVYAGWFAPNPGPWGQFIDTYNVYADIPRWLSLTIYLLLAYRLLHSENLPAGNPPYAKWLRQFLTAFLVFQLLWLAYLVPYILPGSRDWLLNTLQWYPVYLPLAFLIYWLGFKGYLVAQKERAEGKKSLDSQSPEAISEIVQKLEQAMTQSKLYLNPSLDLSGLASQVDIPVKVLSAVLNQHLHKNFSEWVNGYRVEAFKEKVQHAGFRHLTIAGLASECGFSSLATFQRIFKQITGMSPSEFKKSRPSGLN